MNITVGGSNTIVRYLFGDGAVSNTSALLYELRHHTHLRLAENMSPCGAPEEGGWISNVQQSLVTMSLVFGTYSMLALILTVIEHIFSKAHRIIVKQRLQKSHAVKSQILYAMWLLEYIFKLSVRIMFLTGLASMVLFKSQELIAAINEEGLWMSDHTAAIAYCDNAIGVPMAFVVAPLFTGAEEVAQALRFILSNTWLDPSFLFHFGLLFGHYFAWAVYHHKNMYAPLMVLPVALRMNRNCHTSLVQIFAQHRLLLNVIAVFWYGRGFSVAQILADAALILIIRAVLQSGIHDNDISVHMGLERKSFYIPRFYFHLPDMFVDLDTLVVPRMPEQEQDRSTRIPFAFEARDKLLMILPDIEILSALIHQSGDAQWYPLYQYAKEKGSFVLPPGALVTTRDGRADVNLRMVASWIRRQGRSAEDDPQRQRH